MAIVDHPCFRQPENKKLRLWRYTDFTKFVSLIASKKLFFRRSDLLDDPFEGSYSKANVALRPHVYKDIPKDKLDSMLSQMSNFSKWVREWTYINCWHANEHESAAMWKLYAQTNESVAIETDYQTLADTLPDNVFLGLVNYIDYDTEWLPEGNTFYPFTHKRKSFEHEREVRAVVQEVPTNESGIHTGLKNSLSGIQINIDVSMLVKCVHVSPTSPDWFHGLVGVTAKQFGFMFEVRKSNLYSGPVF
jgi:hypothetical protein